MKKLATFACAAALATSIGTAAAAVKTVTLAVQNMSCPVCPITVKKALNRVAGVAHADVSYEREEAVVTYDDAKTNVAALIQATTNAGYPSRVRAK